MAKSTEYVLMEVLDSGERVQLALDGFSKLSTWHIYPGDTPTVSVWLPMYVIQVKFAESNATYPYELTLKGTDIPVLARMED